MKVSANLSNCRFMFSVVVFSGFLLVNVCVAVNEELFCHKKGDDCVDKNRVEDHSFLGKKCIRRKCRCNYSCSYSHHNEKIKNSPKYVTGKIQI